MPTLTRRVPGGYEILSLIAVGCLLGVGIIALLIMRWQFTQFQHEVYVRCIQRQQYDERANQARDAMRQLFITNINIERDNKFIDNTIRQRRITAYDSAVNAIVAANQATVTGGCEQYKP
jgi:hypothetical protein